MSHIEKKGLLLISFENFRKQLGRNSYTLAIKGATKKEIYKIC